MKQKLMRAKSATLVVLALVFALCVGAIIAFTPNSKTVFAATTEGDTITFSEESDFDITDGVLNGLSTASVNAITTSINNVIIVVPEGVTEIGEDAFSYANGMDYIKQEKIIAVTLPASIKIISDWAFDGCYFISTVNYDGSLEQWLNIEFTTYASVPMGFETALNIKDADGNYKTITEVDLSGKKVGAYALYSNTAIKELTLDSDTELGEEAIYGLELDTLNYNGDIADLLQLEEGVTAKSIKLNGNSISGEIVVPASVQKLTNILAGNTDITKITFEENSACTEIAYGAFRDCTGLTSVSIPESVIEIGENILRGCSALQELTVPFVGDDTQPPTVFGEGRDKKILGYFFATLISATDTEKNSLDYAQVTQCYSDFGVNMNATYLIPKTLKKVTVLGGNIGIGAFSSTTGSFSATAPTLAENAILPVTEVTLGAHIMSIGEYVFYGSANLTTVRVSGALQFPDTAFIGTQVTAPTLATETFGIFEYVAGTNSVYSFADDVDKNTLTEITLDSWGEKEPDSIPAELFAEMPKLESVIIPESVVSIGARAFYDCEALKTVTFNGNGKLKTLGESVFAQSAIENIVLSDGLTAIPESAFEGCRQLKSINIPSTVETIKRYAFNMCSNLAEVNFKIEDGQVKSSLKTIEAYAFMVCPSLRMMIIPETVTSIANSAFNTCIAGSDENRLAVVVNLSGLDIQKGAKTFGGVAFNAVMVIDHYVPDLFETTADGYVFLTANDKYYLMDYCGDGGDVTLPATYKGSRYAVFMTAFNMRNQVTTLTVIDNSVTEIGAKAFYNNDGIKRITIGSGVAQIGQGAFQLSNALERVTLAGDIDVISDYAFNNCNSLYELIFEGDIKEIGANAFSYCSLSAIALPDSVVSVGESAFAGNTTLTMVRLGKSLQTIGGSAFSGCSGLTEIIIPTSVTTIGNSAFANCTRLNRVVFETGSVIESLPAVLFYKSSSLEVLELPKSIKTLASDAFYSSSLKTIYIPADMDAACAQTLFAIGYTNAQIPENAAVVARDKATYDKFKAAAAAASNIGQLAYEADITFKVYANANARAVGDELATYTTIKLVNDAGILPYEKSGQVWNKTTSAFPTQVGLFGTADSNKWVKDDDGNYTYTIDDVTLALDNLTYSIEYSGKAWTLNDSIPGAENYLEVVSFTQTNRFPREIKDVGTYSVVIKLKEGYTWNDGTAGNKTITLTITKYETELIWRLPSNWTNNSKSYNGRTIEEELQLVIVEKDGTETVLSNGILIRTDILGNPVNASLDAGTYVYTINTRNSELGNYSIINSEERRLTITPLTINITAESVVKWATESGVLSSGSVYVYEKSGAATKYSHKQLDLTLAENTGYRLVEIRAVRDSIAYYKDSNITLNFAENGHFTSEYTLNTQTGKAVNRYETTVTLTAEDNYALSVGALGDLSEYGVVVTLNNNGTVTISKVWYILSRDNALLVAAGGADWTIAQTHSFGAVVATAPVLEHGTNQVSFTLVNNTLAKAENNTLDTVWTFTLAEFDNYINATMPAGEYSLTAVITDVPDTVTGLVYVGTTQRFTFTVEAADIGFTLAKGESGYASYEWKYDAENKADFFNMFYGADNYALKDKVTLTSFTREGHWADHDEYYVVDGKYTVTYNFTRLNTDTYYAVNNNDLLSAILDGAHSTYGTYTVYFEITAPNHNALSTQGESRYDYYFTVVVYETLTAPEVDDITYTGESVLPTVRESDLYKGKGLFETVWGDSEYISGGAHSVSFTLNDKVHYRWVDADGKEIADDTVSVNFTINKAENVFTDALNMLGWNFETFNAAVNNIRATVRFLDEGEAIHFRVVKKGEATALNGLGDFTVDENGKVNSTVAGLLNALKTGEYVLYAKINGTGNYLELENTAPFKVEKSINTWADGEDDLVLPSWIVGKYNADENIIAVNAAHGTVNIVITDLDGNEYYNSTTGVNNLNDCAVGKYLLKAWVDETEDYAALAERTFTIEVFEKAGLPWWAVLLIVIGSLGVAALVLWILHEKGVLQMLTGRIVIAMRTKMTVDATIAAVRANKRAEESKKSIARAEAQDRIEAMRKAREEERNKSPEERAAALEERAATEAAKAEKAQQRAEKLQKQAKRLKGDTEAENPDGETPPTDLTGDEAAAAADDTNNTDEE